MTIYKRESLWNVEARYNDGTDRATLQNLVKAFKGIQRLPPDDPNSFYCLAGFHGEPFRGKGVTKKDWWGGYCHHANILFPMWHRAYLLRFENALRSVDGCENVSVPYWDELIGYDGPNTEEVPLSMTIPTILTSPIFEGEPNPLYSYSLQQGFQYQIDEGNERYSKPVGYQTVRYPRSGLVGTDEDRQNTEIHNDDYIDEEKSDKILRGNVANWLTGHVDIPDDGSDARIPDVTSAFERLIKSLKAPNYTLFSNTASQDDNNSRIISTNAEYVVSLESSHNAIHLAMGGFYQEGNYNADPILNANGDMGCNETASFDPIFFFHHSFNDYVVWKWQELHSCTTEGSITIDQRYKGTMTETGLPVPEGAPEMPQGTPLTLDTPLYPFLKDDARTYFTSNDLVDIRGQLGYEYGPGSLDNIPKAQTKFGIPSDQVPTIQKISGIDRRDYWGSFVVRLYCYISGEKVEVGREAVLSRLKLDDCPNCQDSLEKTFFIPLHRDLIPHLEKDNKGKFRTIVGIHTHDREHFPEEGGARVPIVTSL